VHFWFNLVHMPFETPTDIGIPSIQTLCTIGFEISLVQTGFLTLFVPNVLGEEMLLTGYRQVEGFPAVSQIEPGRGVVEVVYAYAVRRCDHHSTCLAPEAC